MKQEVTQLKKRHSKKKSKKTVEDPIQLKQLDMAGIRTWLQESVEKMIEIRHLEKDLFTNLHNYLSEQSVVEEEIDSEQ